MSLLGFSFMSLLGFSFQNETLILVSHSFWNYVKGILDTEEMFEVGGDWGKSLFLGADRREKAIGNG